MSKLQSTVIEKKNSIFNLFSISHLAIIFFNFFDSHNFRHIHVLFIFLSAIFFSIKEINIKLKNIEHNIFYSRCLFMLLYFIF